jgi:hypothetical protein
MYDLGGTAIVFLLHRAAHHRHLVGLASFRGVATELPVKLASIYLRVGAALN